MNFEELKQEIEEQIRTGGRERARTLLMKLKGKPIPRSRASTFATLARRTGLLTLGLQIMAPIVRPKVALEIEATDEEKATYSTILLGFGANSEALEILSEASPEHPDILLSLAFTHIKGWDYLAANKFLKKYLKHESITEYQKLVGKVNLAASYIALSEVKEGRVLLEEILQTTQENNWLLLYKNALELSAQVAIQESDWTRAKNFLKLASDGRESGFNTDDFFIRKWQAILEVQKNGNQPAALELLLKIRNEALAMKHWETVRDCDYHRAVTLNDAELSLRVYFGTPYLRFRDRLTERLKGQLEIPEQYLWKIFDEPSNRVFDLRRGEEQGRDIRLKPGKSLHLGLQKLASDFYRPFLVGSLHSALFAGEHFNPVSSPRRVSFLVHRLREWLKESEIPVSLVVDRDGYRLQANGAYVFCVSEKLAANSLGSKSGSAEPAHYLLMLEKLRDGASGKPLSVAQVAESLSLSVRSAHYFLKWATEQKKLSRVGVGRATRYKCGR